jgi:hypothetical protein
MTASASAQVPKQAALQLKTERKNLPLDPPPATRDITIARVTSQ